MNKFLQTSLILTIVLSSSAEVLRNPTSYSSDIYKEIILNGNYDLSIDHPNKFLDFKYGERVASTNQIEDAINCFKTALKSNGNYVIALNNLAKCQQEVNLISESIANFEKSLKLDPNKKKTFEEYASTLFKANNHMKALRYLDKSVGTINFSHEKVSIS